MSEEYPYDMNEVLDEMAVAPYKTEIARLRAATQKIKEATEQGGSYRLATIERIIMEHEALEGKDE